MLKNFSKFGRATSRLLALHLSLVAIAALPAYARDIDYQDEEVSVFVTPGEPTQVQFPGSVSGGVKKKASAISLDYKDSSLVLFGSEGLPPQGEAMIVRLKDGRSYSLRVRRAEVPEQRDDSVKIEDTRVGNVNGDPLEEPAYKERKFDYAPPTQVNGLVREMILAAEFGKKSIPGYRASERFKGEAVLNDGTLVATIDTIFMGPNLWGYVLDASNLLDSSQKLNPATFRLDGTRAVSLQNFELAARPMNVEQQIAGKHSTKVYVVTKAR